MNTIEDATPDFAEHALIATATEVRAAEKAICAVVATSSGGTWTPRQLQEQAKNGWSMTVMNIAFWNLVNSGRLSVDERFRVKPSQS